MIKQRIGTLMSTESTREVEDHRKWRKKSMCSDTITNYNRVTNLKLRLNINESCTWVFIQVYREYVYVVYVQ